MIEELKPNEFIVVGTNMWGRHGGGAAAQAQQDFGLKEGINEGLSGQTYAFPTLEREMTQRGINALRNSKDRLYATARALPEKTFLLTKVGCGIAGYPEEDMKALFTDTPQNIVKPEGW